MRRCCCRCAMPDRPTRCGGCRGSRCSTCRGRSPIGADISGRLVDPQIRGSLKADGARIESAVTGMVVERIQAQGRFAGPRLVLSADQRNDAGRRLDLPAAGRSISPAARPALDLKFDASRARLLDRDDIAATVTGPLAIRSSGKGGTISGKLRLNSGRFTLGRASAAASVPQLKVRNVGQDAGHGDRACAAAAVEARRRPCRR